MTASVISAGFHTTVQDCGRRGFRRFGVSVGGALDTDSLRMANLLIGNDECAAGLELSSRIRLRLHDNRLVAWAGAAFDVRLAGTPIPALHCGHAPMNSDIEISPTRGGRAWLALSGGIDVAEVLASRSTDTRAKFGGMGGRPLRDGDELRMGAERPLSRRIAGALNGKVSSWSAPSLGAQRNRLRCVRGRNWDDLSDSTQAAFVEREFRVGLSSDRMGLRLEAGNLESLDRELLSEAVMPGTVQLPRGGNPILLLADCQTIGGYPKIAHVITVDLARAAQLQPMDHVRFEPVTLARAQELLLARERDIALFRAGIQARFG